MKRPTLLLALGAGLLALALASCTKGAQVEPVPEPTTMIHVTPPSAVLVSETADDSNCIACHTDKAELQDLAKEPEGESLNEGEG